VEITVPAYPEFDSLWDFNDPAATEQRFRALLPGPRSRAWRAEIYSQIARALGLQRRFDPAHALLNQAEGLLGERMHRARVRVLLERGRVYNSSGDPASSRALFLSALELAQEKGLDFYAVDAAHMLGIVEPLEVGMEWNERAIKIAQASSDPRARNWLGSLLNNLGWSKMDLGRYEESLQHFQDALAFREEKGKPLEIHIAKWCVARVLRALGRLEEALAIQQALYAAYQAGQAQDGYVSEEMGELLLEMGRAAEARPYFAEAYQMLSQDAFMAANEAVRLERLKKLGG
jgi:tetratricopeptide (TPR) repeat protein